MILKRFLTIFKRVHLPKAVFLFFIILLIFNYKKNNTSLKTSEQNVIKENSILTNSSTDTKTRQIQPDLKTDKNKSFLKHKDIPEFSEELNQLNKPDESLVEDEEDDVGTIEEDTSDSNEELRPKENPTVQEKKNVNEFQPIFTDQEIQELNKSSPAKSNLIPGIASNNDTDSTDNSQFIPIDPNGDSGADENSDENPDEETELPYVTGQARGYTILNLMQAKARQSVRMQLSTMYHARIKHMYLGVLIDGTFSWDFPWFASVIRELNADGRTLTLALYLTNGSTMRTYDSTPIRTAFSQMSPDEFRERIRFDPTVRSQFQSYARRAQQILIRACLILLD